MRSANRCKLYVSYELLQCQLFRMYAVTYSNRRLSTNSGENRSPLMYSACQLLSLHRQCEPETHNWRSVHTHSMLIRDRRHHRHRERLDQVIPEECKVLESPSHDYRLCGIIGQVGLSNQLYLASTVPRGRGKRTRVRTAYDTNMSLLPSCSFTGSRTSIAIHLPPHSAGSTWPCIRSPLTVPADRCRWWPSPCPCSGPKPSPVKVLLEDENRLTPSPASEGVEMVSKPFSDSLSPKPPRPPPPPIPSPVLVDALEVSGRDWVKRDEGGASSHAIEWNPSASVGEDVMPVASVYEG